MCTKGTFSRQDAVADKDTMYSISTATIFTQILQSLFTIYSPPPADSHFSNAINSISHLTPNGNLATSTQLRAGLYGAKNSA